ncbi:hypothetical protein Tco_0167010 [Tanacetum coccineum]
MVAGDEDDSGGGEWCWWRTSVVAADKMKVVVFAVDLVVMVAVGGSGDDGDEILWCGTERWRVEVWSGGGWLEVVAEIFSGGGARIVKRKGERCV